MDFTHLCCPITFYNKHLRSDCRWISGLPAKADAQRMAPGDAPVAKGHGRVVIPRDEEVGPSVVVEIDDGEGLGVARDDQPTFRGRDGR